jgi:ABC-2 type transport system permease protein
MFLIIILFIFSRLWAAVLARGDVAGAGPRELVWYLAITEWCMLSVAPIFLTIEADIRSGDVACHLVRPVSYTGARLAEALGETAARLLVLGPVAAAGAWLLAGGLPVEPYGLLFALPLGLLSSLLTALFVTAIGLSAFWIIDTSPLFWIWQKLLFILGGLMLPLDIYPGWLQTLARYSPFPAMLWGPGRTAFGWSPRHAAATAGALLAWSALMAATLAWLARRASRRIAVAGG